MRHIVDRVWGMRVLEDHDQNAVFHFKWGKKSLGVLKQECDVLWLKRTSALAWTVGRRDRGDRQEMTG